MLISFKTSGTLYRLESTIFEKKEMIRSRIQESEAGGIIRSGCVFLEYTDPDGIRRILDVYNPGDIYLLKGLPFAGNDSFTFTAQTASRLDLLFELPEGSPAGNASAAALDPEEVCIGMQSRLLEHLHIAAQHTLEKKLLCLFEYLSNGRSSFTLPMSLTDCADFIGADRSAMMRALGKLKANGHISHKGRRIELLHR